MADKNTTVSFFYGAKDGIQAKLDDGTITPSAKLDDGTITPSDFVVTKEDELVFIDKAKAQHTLGSSKTKAPIKVTGTSLGGIADGTTLEAGTSLDDFLKKLLVKRIPATYTKPTLKLETTVATTPQEVGKKINPTIKAIFTKADAGDLTAIEINKGADKVEGTQSPLESAQEVTFADEAVTFSAKATYGQGAIKNDNLNEPSPNGRIEAGTINSQNNLTFQGKRQTFAGTGVATYGQGAIKNDNLNEPSPNGRIEAGTINSQNNLTFQGKRQTFAGTGVGSLPELNSVNVRKFTARGLGLGKNSKFDILVDVGQQHIVIAYPATIGNITQIRYEEGNDNNMAANFQKQVVQVEGANAFTPINYNVYTYTMDVPAAAKMTFKITL